MPLEERSITVRLLEQVYHSVLQLSREKQMSTNGQICPFELCLNHDPFTDYQHLPDICCHICLKDLMRLTIYSTPSDWSERMVMFE